MADFNFSQMARAFLHRNPSSRKTRFGHETITPTSSLTDDECRALAAYAQNAPPDQLASEDVRSLMVERQLRQSCQPFVGADAASTAKKRTAEATGLNIPTGTVNKRRRRIIDDDDDDDNDSNDDNDVVVTAPFFAPPPPPQAPTGYQPPSRAPTRGPRIHTPHVRRPPQLEMGEIAGQAGGGGSSFDPFVATSQAQLGSLYPSATGAFTGAGYVLNSGNVSSAPPQPQPLPQPYQQQQQQQQQQPSASTALSRLRKSASRTGVLDEEWCKGLRPQSFVIPTTASSKGKKACDTAAIQPRRGKIFTAELQDRTATTFYHELLSYMNPRAGLIPAGIVEAIIQAQEARRAPYDHSFRWYIGVLGLVNHYWHGSKEWYYDDRDKYVLGKILSCNYDHVGPQDNINLSDIFKNKETALRFMEKFAVQENVQGVDLCIVDEGHLSNFMDTILRYNRGTLVQAYIKYLRARQSRRHRR